MSVPMTNSPVGPASLADSTDDPQLTIRIPNPKVFMALRPSTPNVQSLLMGNSRMQVHTPPDSCSSWHPKMRSLSLPQSQEDKETECNYTPKKRHKVPTDHGPIPKDPQVHSYAAKTASFLISDMPPEEKYSTGTWIAEHPEHASKGKFPPGMYEIYSSGSQGSDDDSNDEDKASSHRSKYDRAWTAAASSLGIRTVNPGEMPSREAFDDALLHFVGNLPPELKEVSAFMPDAYAEIAQAIEKNDASVLSERLRPWTLYHHVRSGSRKYHLLLLPKEAYFNISPDREEKLRNEFIAEVDGEAPISKASSASSSHGSGSHGASQPEGTTAFLRVPVSPQIYDILVYAHKNHSSTSVTLAEVRQVGIASITWPMAELFHRLCPICSMRAASKPVAVGQ
ncbi:hypothetical protein EWM64_g10014 [Hericium alpestre]|uniref:Uncharacterized protein n=1 Tax=Hericium alpestre TaxID=135208 RepID=A0A4Y9ZKN9_9AGAM|nr:hypothetical protein EWM64_g10014 [Hericium alpestre]